MALDVACDERAQRNDVEALPGRVIERRSREPAAEAAPFPRLVNLGVGEGDPVVPAVVSGRAEILDQLPLRIRLAGVSMVDEPAAVLGRELPRFELA